MHILNPSDPKKGAIFNLLIFNPLFLRFLGGKILNFNPLIPRHFAPKVHVY